MKASIGSRGRSRAIRVAEPPVSVKVMRNFAPTTSPISTAALVTAPPTVLGLVFIRHDLVEAVLLGGLDDPRHRAHGVDRPGADRRLAREHQRVGAVEDGVGGVGGLGARRARVLDHRLEHLGGDDDGLGLAAGELDGALLHERHVLERHLDAEVAAGDHDAVEGRDDALEVVDRLRLLDLGDDGHARAELVHDRVDVGDVVGRAHEGQGDHVDAEAHREAEVLAVLVGQRGHADRDAGQVDALVVADTSPPTTVSVSTSVSVDLDGPEHDLAVVDEQEVTGADVTGQAGIRRADDGVVALDVSGRDGEALARLSVTGPSAKRPVRILGPCRSTRMPTARPEASLAARTSR